VAPGSFFGVVVTLLPRQLFFVLDEEERLVYEAELQGASED
jgi:hypothetical protein